MDFVQANIVQNPEQALSQLHWVFLDCHCMKDGVEYKGSVTRGVEMNG